MKGHTCHLELATVRLLRGCGTLPMQRLIEHWRGSARFPSLQRLQSLVTPIAIVHQHLPSHGGRRKSCNSLWRLDKLNHVYYSASRHRAVQNDLLIEPCETERLAACAAVFGRRIHAVDDACSLWESCQINHSYPVAFLKLRSTSIFLQSDVTGSRRMDVVRTLGRACGDRLHHGHLLLGRWCHRWEQSFLRLLLGSQGPVNNVVERERVRILRLRKLAEQAFQVCPLPSLPMFESV
mmetsp:Transcript_10994/g.23121  ORF Transcript_10994/g.23121 Transcript_10994/m.23121 type:complete len:237 (+) Transcript_10994:802-1512(+)